MVGGGRVGVLSVVGDAHALASPHLRDYGVWVMGRGWYDRVRRVFVSEEQERARAAAHAGVWVSVGSAPDACPACGLGVSGAGLVRHVADFSDPGFREPSLLDRLLGLRLRVVEGDVVPCLVSADEADAV